MYTSLGFDHIRRLFSSQPFGHLIIPRGFFCMLRMRSLMFCFFFGSCAMRVGVFARVLGDRIFRKAQTIAYTVLLRWKFFIWRKKRRATISAIVVAFGKHLFSHETYCIAHFALGGMHTPYLLPGGPRANWRKGDLGQHSVIKANWGIKEYRSWQVHWRTTLLWKA